jgi:hypothetical protein
LDRRLAEARLVLNLIASDELPSLAWDAWEAGLDGPAMRRLAAFQRPTAFELRDVLPPAIEEMQPLHLELSRAALRLANHRARGILRAGKDPLRFTREFERLWIDSGYAREITEYGTLDDEVISMARGMGQSGQDIRIWLVPKLEELTARDLHAK